MRDKIEELLRKIEFGLKEGQDVTELILEWQRLLGIS